MANTIKILVRNDTGENWASKNPVLLKGEQGYDSTANRFKVGDGVKAWNDLPYLADDDTKTEYTHPTYTSRSAGPTANASPAFGSTFTVPQVANDTKGHVTTLTSRTITIPNATATASAAGLMSAADKSKLDGIATGATKYTHPSYTARTGKPTANATPAFGGTFQVSQITTDATGHVTGVTDRTITIPNATATTSAAGLMSATDKSKLDKFPSSPTTEVWTITLSNGSTVTKTVVLG
ncbi:MAG: hypothetical protein IJU98_08245 [Synergistaceae bacterium]|nr:hypothetical protein [Synergistaceae bacterium]